MSVAFSAALLDAQTAGRLEATRQLLAGGAVVCHAAPRPPAGEPNPYPAITRIPFAVGVGAVADGALTLTTPIEGQCLQAGVIAWCRIETAGGAWLCDFDAADLDLDVTAVMPGAFVRLMSGVFR